MSDKKMNELLMKLEFELLSYSYREFFNAKWIIYHFVDWTVENEFKNESFFMFCEKVDEADMLYDRKSKEIEEAVKQILEESGEKDLFYQFLSTLKY